jgi:hypothetical protein
MKILASGGYPASNDNEPSASETDIMDVEMDVMPVEVNKTGDTRILRHRSLVGTLEEAHPSTDFTNSG